MNSSDSECFESAGEEFEEEFDEKVRVKETSKIEKKVDVKEASKIERDKRKSIGKLGSKSVESTKIECVKQEVRKVELLSCEALTVKTNKFESLSHEGKNSEPSYQRVKNSETSSQRAKNVESSNQEAKNSEPSSEEAKNSEPSSKQARNSESSIETTKNPEPSSQNIKKPRETNKVNSLSCKTENLKQPMKETEPPNLQFVTLETKNPETKKPKPASGFMKNVKPLSKAKNLELHSKETKELETPETKKIGYESKEESWEAKKLSCESEQSSYKTNKNRETAASEDTEEPNLWEDDEDWGIPTSKSGEEKPTWSSWGSWGVTSLLSTASSITSQVSQSLTTVLESGIGAPDPETLANSEAKCETPQQFDPAAKFGIDNLISGVTHITKLVETTGNKVISGGLDTLETIGKKTMQVLQEGDPGFKKKRAFLINKPVLSVMLREAKAKTETENRLQQEHNMTKKTNYEMLFDDHEGLVHLEALEMLSKQCDIKLETILESKSSADLTGMQETMAQIKELCELNEDEEDDQQPFVLQDIQEKLWNYVTEIDVNISYDKVVTTWEEAKTWFDTVNLKVCTENDLHEQALDILAQLTAIIVERFHKTGELLLVKRHRSTVDEADALVQTTLLLTGLLAYVAKFLADKLIEKSSVSKSEDVNNYITNVYYEAANSCSYIKDAFQLLIPVLQVGAI